MFVLVSMMVAFSCSLVLLVEGEDPGLVLGEGQSSALVQEAVLLAVRAAGDRTTPHEHQTIDSCLVCFHNK